MDDEVLKHLQNFADDLEILANACKASGYDGIGAEDIKLALNKYIEEAELDMAIDIQKQIGEEKQ